MCDEALEWLFYFCKENINFLILKPLYVFRIVDILLCGVIRNTVLLTCAFEVPDRVTYILTCGKLKWYAKFSLQEFGFKCYLYNSKYNKILIAIYDDERQINDNASCYV